MPIIGNIHGETAMHLSLLLNQSVAEFYCKEVLPIMPSGHHSRAIADILPECISNKVPYVGEYMDSRWKSSQHTENLNRADDKKLKDSDGTLTACD